MSLVLRRNHFVHVAIINLSVAVLGVTTTKAADDLRAGAPTCPDEPCLQLTEVSVPLNEASNTPGALLFHFSAEPVGGRPGQAHVAISLGDGRSIHAT